MHMSKRLSSLLVCIFSCATIFAQSVQVSGKVIDKEGNPVPAASVIVKGTNNGVSASAEGRFSIDVASLPTTLIISSIGFQPRQYKVSNTFPVTIQLQLQ